MLLLFQELDVVGGGASFHHMDQQFVLIGGDDNDSFEQLGMGVKTEAKFPSLSGAIVEWFYL